MALTQRAVEAMRDSRARVVELTDQQVLTLTRAWVEAWDGLSDEFLDSLDELFTLNGPGPLPGPQLAQSRRLAQALQQAEQALEDLTGQTVSVINGDLRGAVVDAAESHLASLQAQLPPEFNDTDLVRLSPRAVDQIVTRTSQQVTAATYALTPAAVASMRRELVRGVVVGANPRVTARRMVRGAEGGFNGGLTRAMTIARTETLDAYRQSNLRSSVANQKLIKNKIWVSALDSRTCGSCLAQHGTEWPVDAFGPADHQQGRCTFIDKTLDWGEIDPRWADLDEPNPYDLPDRDAWWGNLTPESQNDVLGKTRAELLRSGKIGWDDLSTRVETPGWRPSYRLTNVRDLPTLED